MRTNQIYVSKNIKQTQKIALNFSNEVLLNSIVYLNGAVGTGKTSFVRKVAEVFDIFDITSSSFCRLQSHSGKINLIHCDIYRETMFSTQLVFELESLLVEPWLLFVEWPPDLLEIPCKSQYIIDISLENDTDRIITINQIS